MKVDHLLCKTGIVKTGVLTIGVLKYLIPKVQKFLGSWSFSYFLEVIHGKFLFSFLAALC